MSLNTHLEKIVLDESTTVEQKADCLKLLKVVLKNLADPVKSKQEKFRQLKLDNEKVRNKILAVGPSAMDYLLRCVGFVQEGEVLRIPAANNIVAMQGSLEEVCNALYMVEPSAATTNQQSARTPEEKKMDDTATSQPATATAGAARLSEKQKARILMEKKQEREREEARLHRKRTQSQIRNDKYVRQNDENWTSAPSAACNKSGSSISTFRDRHGEN